MGDWKTLSSRVAYENPFMRVHEDKAINPAGKETIYGYCESTDNSVYVIPVDEDGNTYLVRQYRYTLKKELWETVAGRAPQHEDPAESARRELQEETGLLAADMVLLGELFSAPGMTTFKSKVFLARSLTKVSDTLDQTDGILELKKLSFDEMDAMIMSGEVRCATGIAAYFLAKEYLKKEQING